MSLNVLYTMPDSQCLAHKFGIQPPSGCLSFLFPDEKTQTPQDGISLSVVLRGDAVVEIDGINHRLCGGTLIYLRPGHWVRQVSCSADFLFGCLWFDLDFLSDFPLLLKTGVSEYVDSNPCLQLKEEDCRLVEKYYTLIADRFLQGNVPPPIIKGVLFSFVLETGRLYSKRNVSISPTRQSELADGFFSLLNQHFRKERSISFYADKLCISGKYLMHVLKNATGHSFHFWLLDFAMREAKLLLRSSAMSVTEISVRLNYPNSSFFSRTFRQHVGMTPSEFRHQ